MMRTRLSIVLSLALAASGCSSQIGPGTDETSGVGGKADEWSTTDPVATAYFADDWTFRLHGELRVGHPLKIVYDPDRLPDCRSEMGGMPQWAVTAHASVDGEELPATLLELGPPRECSGRRCRREDLEPNALLGTIASIPEGEALALSFSITDTFGCHAVDSNFGADFHFEITGGGAGATIRFDADEVRVDGEIEGGTTITVLYDPARVTECRGESGGVPTWSVTGYASVDGATPILFQPTRPSGADRVTSPAEIEIPAGDELAIWFEIHDRWGCTSWDSADGANHRFDLR